MTTSSALCKRAEGQQLCAWCGRPLEEYVDWGRVREAEADDARNFHIVGVKALLRLFGVLRRTDEHDALYTILRTVVPAREEPSLVRIFQEEGEACVN